MLLLKTTETSSMKVCAGKETKQILQSALHSLRNTRSSSRFDLASLQQITNPSSRKLSKKFRNLIGTEKYWGLRNLAGSQCRTSKVNSTYEHTHCRSTGCVEQTVKNKIKKMTFLHVYFGSLGVTKFSKSELYGWQVSVSSQYLRRFLIENRTWSGCLVGLLDFVWASVS